MIAILLVAVAIYRSKVESKELREMEAELGGATPPAKPLDHLGGEV